MNANLFKEVDYLESYNVQMRTIQSASSHVREQTEFRVETIDNNKNEIF